MVRDSQTGLVYHGGALWRSPVVPTLIRIVNFAFGVLYALLGLRFLLIYVEAREVPAVAFIDRLTERFYAPFRGIVASGSDGAGHPIAWALLMAIVAYALLNALIVALLRMARLRGDED